MISYSLAACTVAEHHFCATPSKSILKSVGLGIQVFQKKTDSICNLFTSTQKNRRPGHFVRNVESYMDEIHPLATAANAQAIYS